METEKIVIKNLEKEPHDYISQNELLSGEVEGVKIEFIAIRGAAQIKEEALKNKYDVVLLLEGEAIIETLDKKYNIRANSTARLPYDKKYVIRSDNGAHFLRFRKDIDKQDIRIISKNLNEHSEMFIRTLDDCPVYTEDIKSSKSLNRMILPEGKVPRFCMGSVETEGPDQVAEHEHPMLDQVFLGLNGCKCTCIANGKRKLLTENMILHIPLGSKHSVYVADGDKLAYIWFDFFLSLEGQKYMNEQHHIDTFPR